MASATGDLTHAPPIAEFVRRVAALSGGAIQIKVTGEWGGDTPNAEGEVVQAVASGRVDLGWAGSRVFDSLGASSFRALGAPMLIDSAPLEQAVLDTSMPGQMLQGLKRVHVTGLGVLADALHLPVGVQHALVAPADWRGISFGTVRSTIQEQAIRALGATPVEAAGFYRIHDLDTGAIQGFELDVRTYTRLGLVTKAPYVAANVTLWPQVDVLFANPALLASLTDQQRAWLTQAAEDASTHSVASASETATYISEACARGARFVTASPSELTALRRSLSRVYRNTEQDPQTKVFIERIERLKRATPPGPPLRVPAGCSRAR
jgi:TRAP-type C4-dicarboxylate transport system substrate-binding protein